MKDTAVCAEESGGNVVEFVMEQSAGSDAMPLPLNGLKEPILPLYLIARKAPSFTTGMQSTEPNGFHVG
jgi:hypothetical protein